MANNIIDPQFAALITTYVDEAASLAFNVGTGLLILILGLMLAGFLASWTQRGLGKIKGFDKTLKLFIGKAVRYAVMLIVFVAMLAQFGVQTTSIIAVLGAAGLAIGLALQGTLSNIAAGFMLLILRPFKVGDYVDCAGHAGSVIEIGLFVTQLRTADGLAVTMPNSNVFSGTITNFSSYGTRRFALEVGISYDSDLDAGAKVLKQLADKDKRILKDPKPQIYVKTLGDSAVVLELRAWTNADEYWQTYWDITKDAKVAMDKAGIPIPFPQQDVYLHKISE